jgi:hypothetical protein
MTIALAVAAATALWMFSLANIGMITDGPKTRAPKRRWFQFTLRTLFVVVTVLACWLGYAVSWIKQRHAFLAQPMTKPPPGRWIYNPPSDLDY